MINTPYIHYNTNLELKKKYLYKNKWKQISARLRESRSSVDIIWKALYIYIYIYILIWLLILLYFSFLENTVLFFLFFLTT